MQGKKTGSTKGSRFVRLRNDRGLRGFQESARERFKRNSNFFPKRTDTGGVRKDGGYSVEPPNLNGRPREGVFEIGIDLRGPPTPRFSVEPGKMVASKGDSAIPKKNAKRFRRQRCLSGDRVEKGERVGGETGELSLSAWRKRGQGGLQGTASNGRKNAIVRGTQGSLIRGGSYSVY